MNHTPLPPPLPSQLLAGQTQLDDASISIIMIGLAVVVIVQREYHNAMCGIGIGYEARMMVEQLSGGRCRKGMLGNELHATHSGSIAVR